MIQIKYILPIFLLLLFFKTKEVNAQVPIINKDASPLNISLSAIYIDDINPTILQEFDSYGLGLSGNGQLVTGGEGVQFLVDYSANFEGYTLPENNIALADKQNFHNYQIRLLSRFFIASGWHIDAEIKGSDEIQKFGQGISQLRENVLKADQFQQSSGALTLVYGKDTSSRFVSVKVFAKDDIYKNNNDYSSLFNVVQQGAELNVAFRQSTISSFLFKVSAVSDDYESATREDSDVYRALLGINWQSSGRSKLEALMGMYWRDYSTQSSNSGLSWLVSYSIEPTENWLLKINSARFSDVSKSEFTSDSVKQNIGLDVSYDYTKSLRVGVKGKIENTKFSELDQTTELDASQGSIYASFALKKHSNVSLNLGFTSQSTSDQTIDYQQSQVRLAWHIVF